MALAAHDKAGEVFHTARRPEYPDNGARQNTAPLRIGLDARLAAYRRGMGNYVYSLLWEYANLPVEHRFVLYVDSREASLAVPTGHRFTIRWLRPALYPIWEQLLLPACAARDQLDVLHCPANTAPLWWPGTTKLVVTVHDVMYLLPQTRVPLPHTTYQRLGRRYRRWIVPRVGRKAAKIISVSAYSRADTLQHLHVPPERVTVVHESPSPRFRRMTERERQDTRRAMRRPLHLDRCTIVHPGASDPRKNTERVLRAFADLKAHVKGTHQLVVAGLSRAAQAAFSALARSMEILDDVHLLGFVPEEELVLLYNIAHMVVYPSLYEGFGLPVLEAMACGAPVITSNVSSIPEVAGDAAFLIEPTSTEALSRAMIKVARDEALRRSLIVRGAAQVSKFSWQRAARETLGIYEEVAGG